jgi:hypothetical protein
MYSLSAIKHNGVANNQVFVFIVEGGEAMYESHTVAARSDVLRRVLAGLMRRYQERVPNVARILKAMRQEGMIAAPGDAENDHIAFRTLGVEHLGIQSLEKIFLHYGYERRDAYDFPAKKLDAFWYHPPQPDLPRIFLSELRVAALTAEAQRIIHSYTDEVTADPVAALDLDDAEQVDHFLHHALWHLPTWSDYQRLQAESEYAAWVIYNRYYLNHFTIAVHNLPDGYATIASFNDFLERHHFTLNDAGGKIKTSPDGKLLQSATVAEMVTARFAGGEEHPIAGSYVEFAERRPLDAFAHLPRHLLQREQRREGFEAHNADRIFESTYSSQTHEK